MRVPRPLLIVVAAAALAVVAACAAPPAPDRLDPSQFVVTVAAEMRTAGLGDDPTPVTYILVDVENRAGRDAHVTLTGALLGDAPAPGQARPELVGLTPEELYVPAGAVRTYALVDAERRARPEARGAEVRIRTAIAARHRPEMVVTDVRLHEDPVEVPGGRAARAVVGASLTNEATRPGTVIVFAAFRDAHGRPLARPYDVVGIGAGVTRALRFVGPPGSVDGTVYIGDVTY
ncbi:MAG: hypothetical protein R2939_20555 [Kofleriaceae bacterium]